MAPLSALSRIDLGDQELACRFIGPEPDAAPTLVMLHEGLGSLELWGDFPDRLAQRTACGVFVYTRSGYGTSSPTALPRPLRYMENEALDVLPRVLDAIGFRRGCLVGHSDGGSIATIYAGSMADSRLCGVSLIAPHFFVEEFTTAEIDRVRQTYETGDLRRRLAHYHRDVDMAFWGWNSTWLDPRFKSWDIREYLTSIGVPIQIVQGENDQYGTIQQIEAARERCGVAVEAVLIPRGGHWPHRESPDLSLDAISTFCSPLLNSKRSGKAQAI